MNKSNEKLKWEMFNESNIYDYINNNEIVFLDITADWCITCQVNKITTINTGNINKLFLNNEIKLIKADWTKKDPEILKFISKFGRYGIPVNIIYSRKFNEGILLPEILSQDILIKRLNEVLDEY
jgi:suppressor for copper-sensitivity B